MSAADVLAALRGRGLRLWVEETADGLLPRALGPLGDADRAALKEHRPELIRLLLDEARAERVKQEDPCAMAGRSVRAWDAAGRKTP